MARQEESLGFIVEAISLTCLLLTVIVGSLVGLYDWITGNG